MPNYNNIEYKIIKEQTFNMPNYNNIDNNYKILELKNQINQLKSYFLSPGENLISIKFISCDQNINFSTFAKPNDKFISSDQNINFSTFAKPNDNFSKIENILYNNYPNYKKYENYFLVNGRRINKYNTIKENGIKNNDIITLNQLIFNN